MTETTTEPGIHIVRRFDAAPAQVFTAWTDPAQFSRWFGTTNTPVDDVSMDVRVDGEWRARMLLGDGNEIGWHGKYLELDPPRLIEMTLSDRPGDEVEGVTVGFRPLDGGTEMTFTQVGGHMDEAGYARAEAGWLSFFDDLAAGL